MYRNFGERKGKIPPSPVHFDPAIMNHDQLRKLEIGLDQVRFVGIEVSN